MPENAEEVFLFGQTLTTMMKKCEKLLMASERLPHKDTYRKIRKTDFIYICGSKNGFSSSAVNTGEIWGDASCAQKALCMSYFEFGTKIQTQ